MWVIDLWDSVDNLLLRCYTHIIAVYILLNLFPVLSNLHLYISRFL